jgi:uncharacterized protein YicC (UPF0701 family)
MALVTPTEDQARRLADRRRQEARALKQELKKLTTTVSQVLAALDRVMEQPESPKRGQVIARCVNALDQANDAALHFGLGQTFRMIAREKARLRGSVARPLPSPEGDPHGDA